MELQKNIKYKVNRPILHSVGLIVDGVYLNCLFDAQDGFPDACWFDSICGDLF
jgi:hypothetical protein